MAIILGAHPGILADDVPHPVSGDKLAAFLWDPGHGRTNRLVLPGFLWGEVGE